MRTEPGVSEQSSMLLENAHPLHRSWVVAEGALCYARSDFVEECVAAESLAFTYLGNYTKHGRPLKSGKMHKGLAWVLQAVGCLFNPLVLKLSDVNLADYS